MKAFVHWFAHWGPDVIPDAVRAARPEELTYRPSPFIQIHHSTICAEACSKSFFAIWGSCLLRLRHQMPTPHHADHRQLVYFSSTIVLLRYSSPRNQMNMMAFFLLGRSARVRFFDQSDRVVRTMQFAPLGACIMRDFEKVPLPISRRRRQCTTMRNKSIISLRA
jgi:hypothetical protein